MVAAGSHAASAGGYTLVPLRLYFSDGRAKVEIAIANGAAKAVQAGHLAVPY